MTKYLTVKDVMDKLKEFPEDTQILIEGDAYDEHLRITGIHSQELERHTETELDRKDNFVILETWGQLVVGRRRDGNT